jgi:DNA polymerase-3 subunit delta
MYNGKSGGVYMNCVIYGDEKFIMEQKLNALKKKYDICEENMNIMTYWCHETPMSEIIEDAMTPPFLTEYKMIVLKNPLFLTTQKQKNVSDNDIKLFLDYLSKENPTTLFVIYHDQKNFDERKKVVKTLRKLARFINVEKLDDQQIYKIVHKAIKDRHCEIDNDALELFLSRMSQDLLSISQEVNKICLYSSHITKKDIDVLISKPIEENVFELTKAILNKETGKSIQIYKDLKINNEEPIKLVVLIANSLRLLYQVKLLDRKGYNDAEIGKMLSIKPFRLRYIRQDGKEFELSEILDCINQLSELDIAMKTGKVDRYKGLELFLVRIGGNNEWNH